MTSAHRWVEFLRERAADLLTTPGRDRQTGDLANSYNAIPGLLPPLHPDRPTDAAILELFRRVKSIEDTDGSWNGADVVAVLADWFEGVIGIDITADPDTVEHRLRSAPRQYTVIGLREPTGELLVAAVLPGIKHGVHHDTHTGNRRRVAVVVVGTDSVDAEHRATDQS